MDLCEPSPDAVSAADISQQSAPQSSRHQPSSRRRGQITRRLQRWGTGDPEALAEVVSLVYEELRRRAARRLRCQSSHTSLQPTSLVHEVFLRLLDQQRVSWRDRGHFFAIAALMMRRVLVDEARHRGYAKRGGDAVHLPLDEALDTAVGSRVGLLELDSALAALAQVNGELARVVELRFFAGLTQAEIATLLGVSVPTVVRRWRLARAWLYRQLQGTRVARRHGHRNPGEPA